MRSINQQVCLSCVPGDVDKFCFFPHVCRPRVAPSPTVLPPLGRHLACVPAVSFVLFLFLLPRYSGIYLPSATAVVSGRFFCPTSMSRGRRLGTASNLALRAYLRDGEKQEPPRVQSLDQPENDRAHEPTGRERERKHSHLARHPVDLHLIEFSAHDAILNAGAVRHVGRE